MLQKLILKCMRECKGLRTDKTILKNKNKFGGLFPILTLTIKLSNKDSIGIRTDIKINSKEFRVQK